MSLDRFLVEQNKLAEFESTGISNYERALKEIINGKKITHWIWYIFPQGPFGKTHTSLFFSIESKAEASCYLDDPILGFRLREITQAILHHKHLDIEHILENDKKKFHASMTLFAHVDLNPTNEFRVCLNTFFGGENHWDTLDYFKLIDL